MRSRFRDDSGIGMILVIGITIFVAGITATAGVVAINGLGQSRQRIHFEQSLAGAEVGINYALSQLQSAFDGTYSDYPVPTPKTQSTPGVPTAACTAAQITAPDFGAGVDEQAWANSTLDSLVSDHPECLVETPTGPVMVLKPKNPTDGASIKFGRVYSRAFTPDLAGTARTVKVEYVLVPHQPKFAILAGGDLDMSGQMTVHVVPNAPSDGAAVHTNGVLSGTANSIDVQGPMSYTAGATGKAVGWGTQAPKEFISHVSAFNFYRQQEDTDATKPGSWMNLCSDGKAYAYHKDDPCNPTSEIPAPANWSYQASSRTWKAGSSISGTVFVHEANADMTKASAVSATVIASSSGSSTTCQGKLYGNIKTKQTTVGSAAIHGLWLMADADLNVDTQSEFGRISPLQAGMFVAGDQFAMQSNTPNMVTGIVAGGQCNTSDGPIAKSTYQGANMFFDPDTDSPWSSMINVTQWIEY